MNSNVIKISQYREIREMPGPNHVQSGPQPAEITGAEGNAVTSDAYLMAKQVMDGANELGQKLIRETKERLYAESEEIKKKAYVEGFEKGISEGKKTGFDSGYKEGFDRGQKSSIEENKGVKNELLKMMASVERSKAGILKKFEEDLFSLSVAIAEKIIRKEISLDPEILEGMAKNALESYRNQSWVRIILPESADSFIKADSSLIKELSKVSDNVKIIANPNLPDLDLMIELPDRIIDLSIGIQLESIQASVRAALLAK